MARDYSLDLRERIIGFIEQGGSRRAAGRRFEVSASFAIKLYDRWRRTGSCAPKARGGSQGKLASHKGFLITRVEDRPDVTMPELAIELEAECGLRADPASLSRFLCRHGYSYKKNADGHRTRTRRGPPQTP